jgi:hypothetical protein
MPLLMAEVENDNVCSELRKFFANVKVTTLNKPDKQDPKKPPNGWGFRGTGRRERETPGTITEARDALWKTN